MPGKSVRACASVQWKWKNPAWITHLPTRKFHFGEMIQPEVQIVQRIHNFAIA